MASAALSVSRVSLSPPPTWPITPHRAAPARGRREPCNPPTRELDEPRKRLPLRPRNTPLEAPRVGRRRRPILHRAVGTAASTSTRSRATPAASPRWIDAAEVYMSIWPLLRSQLEAGGRLVWVLEPHTPELSGSGRRRAGAVLPRAAGIGLLPVRSPGGPPEPAQSSSQAAPCQGVRGGRAAVWHAPGEGGRGEENIRGRNRQVPRTGRGRRALCEAPAPEPPRDLSQLVGYSHPSIQFINEMLSEDQTSDGFRVTNWHFDISGVDKQTRIAAGFCRPRRAALLCRWWPGRRPLGDGDGPLRDEPSNHRHRSVTGRCVALRCRHGAPAPRIRRHGSIGDLAGSWPQAESGIHVLQLRVPDGDASRTLEIHCRLGGAAVPGRPSDRHSLRGSRCCGCPTSAMSNGLLSISRAGDAHFERHRGFVGRHSSASLNEGATHQPSSVGACSIAR